MDSTGKRYLLEQVITTMASVADTTEDKFTPYYDVVMPFLKHVLINANDAGQRLLRGKAIECISLIGIAVGGEKFAPDADDVMHVLLKAQNQLAATADEGADEAKQLADDPQMSYMMSACARMCKLMKANFAVYLPMVMPHVLKVAAFKPEITVCDNDDVNGEDEDEGWQFVNLGENVSLAASIIVTPQTAIVRHSHGRTGG